jgi:putative ABC transport system permease protein
MAHLSALAMLLRRERSELTALGLVALLVAFTAFVFSAGIRLLERAADDGLRREVAAASVVQRTIRLTTSRMLEEPESRPTVADWHADGEQLRTMFARPVQDLVGDANLAIGSTRLRVANPPDYPMFMTLRYRDQFEELAELAAGRWPAATGDQLPPVVELPTFEDEFGFLRPTDHAADEPRRFEVAVLESTARQLGLEVGSQLSVGVDLVDPLVSSSDLRTVEFSLAPTELEVSGLYRVRDQFSDAWFGDFRLAFDDLGDPGGVELPVAYISAYVPADELPGLVSSGLPFEYQWQFPILADRLDAAQVEQTKRGLRILETRFAGTRDSDGTTAVSGLLPLLDRYSTVRTASQAVLALAASGPLTLAAGAIAMAAVMLMRRRRAATIVVRGRGASGRLVLAASLIEAVVVAGAACLVGLGLAVVLEPSAELQPSLLTAAAIGVVAVVLLAGAAWPQTRQPLSDIERGSGRARRRDPRRLVAELSVVALAVVGAYVLRQRGVATAGVQAGGSQSGATVGFDPFLAAVPPLIGLAAGIAALWAYPPAMAVAGWLAGRRRDLVPVLGVRSVARGAASNLPALVLILAVAFAAFTSVVSASVDQAQQAASWLETGADARLEAVGSSRELPSVVDASAIPGATATAIGYVDPRARVSSNRRVITSTLQAVDAAAYAELVAGSPIEPSWPPEFLAQPVDGPLPASVGSALARELRLARTDTFEMNALRRSLELQVVDVRSDLVGPATSDSLIIVPYSWLQHAVGPDIPVSVIWMRIAPEEVATVRSRSGADEGAVSLISRYDAYDALRNQPLLGAVGAGFALAFAVSVAYAVLTILGAVVISAGRRRRDVAVLRTLGLNRRQQTRLTMAEHAPPILLALAPGLALGIGVAVAVAPALGLGAFSGSRADVPLAIDWLALAALSAALAALALAAVVFGSWLSRRTAIINALRIGSE